MGRLVFLKLLYFSTSLNFFVIIRSELYYLVVGGAFIKVGNSLRQKLQGTASTVFKNLLYLLPIFET